jgi:hypothetical protein
MTSPPVLPNGLYTISKEQRELATLQSVKPGTDVVLQPSNPDEFPDQRVGSISFYSYSRIRSYDILSLHPVGGPENTKGNLYHNQPGKLSVVRRGTRD